MAEHPLAPFKAKLDRADKSLRTLNTQYKRVSDTSPLRADMKVDFQGGWHTGYIAEAKPLPPNFSALIGESLYHGRSVLEHLVWSMVKRNGKMPRNRHTFPILEKPPTRKGSPSAADAFVRVMQNDKLSGVPLAAITLIEKCQPYNAPKPPLHFLSILNRMARDDRHHALHASYLGGTGTTLDISSAPLPEST